ncbi:hypothetical protein AGOR_G00168650 [Albula goreensis]|uniref:Shelterin complex subunit TPP1/Est3 domain-containing protein n=1 Tax=Albula goreensis TaxID=1534307 RepID=A0A8T3D5Q8_9TELE|nr:hypothetical protein AGOR_G00168650 [Albula goreensis]
MIKTRRSKIEPWIETLIQSYGQQEKTKGVKGYVLEVGDFSKSSQQEENAVAVLFISDGVVHIPVVLTKEAWEMMQEMEERDTVSNLENCTVFLQRYSLGFQREADMFRSKFFLTVNKLASVAFGAIIDKVPCCTSLPTVRQKICDTWRLLEGENSPTIMESQSEFCLTELLMEWEEDRPSTSRAVPRPVWPSSMLPTGWHADRVRYRGQKSFTVPLSHLYISAEQNEQIQDHPGNSTAAGACDPVGHEDRRSLPNSGQDGNSLLGSAEQEEAPVNPWDIFAPAVENLSSSSLEVSRESVTPDLTLDSTLLLPQLEGELLSNEPVCVPMATSTQALPSERSSSRELFTSSDQSNSSALATGAARPEDTKAVEAHSLGLPGASTQTFTSSSTSSLVRVISSGSDNQTLPPYQRPCPHSNCSSTPIHSGSSLSLPGTSASSADCMPPHPQDLCRKMPAARQHPPPCICEEDEEGIVTRNLGNARKSSALKHSVVMVNNSSEEDEEVEGEGQIDGCSGCTPKRKLPRTSSPPSWLFQTQAAGSDRRRGQRGGASGSKDCPTAAASPSNAVRVTIHPDGTPFSYCYQPTPCVAKAMSLVKIPDDFVQWSVRYLVRPGGSENTS